MNESINQSPNQFGNDDHTIYPNQGYPHHRPHTRDQIDRFRLDAGAIVACPEGVGLGAAPTDAGEEAVFGEDCDGVDEEDDGVEESAEPEQEHAGGGGCRRGGEVVKRNARWTD